MVEKAKSQQSTTMPSSAEPTSDVALGLARLYEEADGDLVAFAPDGESFTVFTEHRTRLPDYPG